MKKILILPLLVVLIFMFSCGPNQDELASQSLDRATSLLEHRDTVGALSVLDSALLHYPKASKVLPQLELMKGNVYTDLCNHLKKQIDSCEVMILDLSKDFVIEKRPYDNNKWYVYKRQTLKRSWNRSFIEVNLNDKGEIYLTSNYIGKKSLNHTAIRVYDKKLSCKTFPVELGTVDNHHSEFMESKWEKVSYKDGASDDLIRFFVSHADRHLKAVFLGKRYYYILLEKYDKDAVVKSYNLSLVLKKRAALKKELKHIDQRMCSSLQNVTK